MASIHLARVDYSHWSALDLRPHPARPRRQANGQQNRAVELEQSGANLGTPVEKQDHEWITVAANVRTTHQRKSWSVGPMNLAVLRGFQRSSRQRRPLSAAPAGPMKVAGGKPRPQGGAHPPVRPSKTPRAPAGRMTIVPAVLSCARPGRVKPCHALGFPKLPTGYLHARLRREAFPGEPFHRKQRFKAAPPSAAPWSSPPVGSYSANFNYSDRRLTCSTQSLSCETGGFEVSNPIPNLRRT